MPEQNDKVVSEHKIFEVTVPTPPPPSPPIYDMEEKVLPPLLSSEQVVLMTHKAGATLQVHSKASLSKQQAK